jgi:hypothetical protein
VALIPAIPGVPQLPPGVNIPALTALATQAVSGLLCQASQSPPAWGIFDDQGNQVIVPDSVLELSHHREFNVSDYPIQKGSFADYNKVIRPQEVHLRLSKGGSVDDRSGFLQQIDSASQSLALYTVASPERAYQNMNLDRYDIVRRGAQGAAFLTEVDVHFVEILQVQAQYTNTPVLPNAQSEAAQPTSNVGTVYPQNPDTQLQQDGNLALQSQTPSIYNGGGG